MDDPILIRNYCESGDRESAALLFERYEKGLYNFIWQMLRHDQDTEDATQETVGKALAALPRYRPEHSFKSWLFKIGHNEAVNIIRKRRRVLVHEAPEELAPDPGAMGTPSPEPAAWLDQTERAHALQEAIGRLPPPERQVVILRMQEEVPFKEIALIVGAPLGTVLARMHNAKKRLRTILEPVLSS